MANLRQPSTASVTLGDIMSNRFAPIQEALFKVLGPKDEARLSQVSRELSMTSKRFRDWDGFLANFFSDPKAFRSLQAKSNTIVTGDVVLDFFARTKKFLHTDPLLVLIIPYGFGANIDEFLENDGYTSLSKGSHARHDQYWPNVYDEYVHSRRSTNDSNQAQVLLCIAPDSATLTFFADMTCDTTLSHNFVTWNKAYSFFPYQTFVRKEGYFLMPCINNARHHETGQQLRLLAAAGYKLKDLTWYSEQNESLTRRRRFGDKHSWIIDLPINGITPSPVPDGVVASSAFRIGRRDSDEPQDWECQNYCKSFQDLPLTSPVLRYGYMMEESENEGYKKKVKYLKQRLHGLTIIELAKLPESERPPHYEDLLWEWRSLDNFTVPSHWTYYDEDVIEYLDRIEKELGGT